MIGVERIQIARNNTHYNDLLLLVMRQPLLYYCLVIGLLSSIKSDLQSRDSHNDDSATTKTALSLSKLSRYNISSITVSGLSAGGYMAVQVHVAHSIIIDGAAVFAGVSD